MKKKKYIEIRISQDWKMIMSEWIMFGISLVTVAGFIWKMIDFIKGFSESGTVLALIVLLLVLMKLVPFVRFPVIYNGGDVIREIEWEMEARKNKNA